MLNERKFSEGMVALCEVSKRSPSKILLRAYFEALKDLSDQEFENAVCVILQEKTFSSLPTPGEIREMARGKSDDLALIALDEVEKAMARVGAYRTVSFSDPVVNAVVLSLGGWVKVCHMPVDDWKFARRDFLKTYRAFQANRGRIEIPEKLYGVADKANSGSFEEENVVMIGNKKRELLT